MASRRESFIFPTLDESTLQRIHANRAAAGSQPLTDDQIRRMRAQYIHSSICNAAKAGDIEKIQELLEVYGVTAGITDHLGETPLHAAAGCGQIQVMEFLLNHGAALESVNNQGYTPLSFACWWGQLTAVAFLLEKGADKDLNILNHSIRRGIQKPLHAASEHGQLKVVQLLHQHGADLNNTNDNLETPVHCASKHGRTELVRWFVDNGVNLNCRDRHNKTPLQVANQNAFFSRIDPENNVQTFLEQHLAWINQHNSLVRYLVKEGILGRPKGKRLHH